MDDQQQQQQHNGFVSRMKRMFRRGPDIHNDLPLLREIDRHHSDPPVEQQQGGYDTVSHADTDPHASTPDTQSTTATQAPPPNGGSDLTTQDSSPRRGFRFWQRRPDPAVANLQRTFVHLLDLTAAIKDNLERQGQRHDELIAHLAHLPRVMDAIPETSRVQAESLRAISQQMESQSAAQRQLATILERINLTGGDQRKILDAMRERLETLGEHDAAVADNLSSFGAAMQSVSRSSQASTQVLEGLREGMTKRDDEVTKILDTQNRRYTVLIGVAVFMSVASLIATAVIAYLLYTRQPQVITTTSPAAAPAVSTDAPAATN